MRLYIMGYCHQDSLSQRGDHTELVSKVTRTLAKYGYEDIVASDFCARMRSIGIWKKSLRTCLR
jgi:hypothetical protein